MTVDWRQHGVKIGLPACSGLLTGSIKESAPAGATAGRWQRRFRSSLVVAEVALAFVLLASAGLLIRSFFSLQQRIGVGFDSTNVLTARLPISPTRFAEHDALNAYLEFVFGVAPSNPTTIAAVAGILTAVALAACYIPARRAASIDPSVALRSE